MSLPRSHLRITAQVIPGSGNGLKLPTSPPPSPTSSVIAAPIPKLPQVEVVPPPLPSVSSPPAAAVALDEEPATEVMTRPLRPKTPEPIAPPPVVGEEVTPKVEDAGPATELWHK